MGKDMFTEERIELQGKIDELEMECDELDVSLN
jgi:hypothetical protein